MKELTVKTNVNELELPKIKWNKKELLTNIYKVMDEYNTYLIKDNKEYVKTCIENALTFTENIKEALVVKEYEYALTFTDFKIEIVPKKFDEEKLKIAKDKLTSVRKINKGINNHKKDVKKIYNAESIEFESDVKEAMNIVTMVENGLDEQVKSFENKIKEERRLEILSLDGFEAISEFVQFDDNWLLKKWNDKLLTDLFIGYKNDIDSKVTTISLLATTNGLDKEFYIDKLKTMPVEQVVKRITEDMQNLKVEVKEEAPTIKIDTNEKVITITRKLKGTVTALTELKRYAESIGIEWTK